MTLRLCARTIFIVGLGARLAAVGAGYAAPRLVALRAYAPPRVRCQTTWQYLDRRPQCAPLAEDEVGYDALGRSIAAGRGFVLEQRWLIAREGEPTAYGGFLYPALVGVVYRLSGDSVLALLACQAVLGALGAVGVWWIAGRLAPRRAADAAGLLAALHPGLALASAMVMTEALIVPLLIAACALWIVLAERPGWPRAAALGLVAGGACLTRSPALYALPLMALAGVLAARSHAPRLRDVVVAVAVCALTLVPWTVRNARLFGAFVPADTKAGGNLWLFNHPSPDPLGEVWRGAPDAQPPPAPVPGLNEAQAELHFRRLALSHAWHDPWSVARVTALRLALVLVPVPRSAAGPVLNGIVALFYGLVTWAGLAGWWRLRRDARGRALMGLGAAWIGLLALTAMGLRHRLSIEWLFVIGAAVTLDRVLETAGRRRSAAG